MYQLRRTALLVIFACIGGSAHAQTGLIRGTLLDTDGNPLAKADVYAMFTPLRELPNKTAKEEVKSAGEDSYFQTSTERVDATTDQAGRFELQGLQWGAYELLAQKPEDGYCSLLEEPMRVVLSPTSPYSQVIFHLPPKCTLLTGKVKNAKTGELLSGVTLRLRRQNDKGHCTIIGAIVPVHQLIPSQWEFTLEILAQGFETWAYRFDETPAFDTPPTPLTLRAGENFDLDVALTPKAAVMAKPYAIDCPIINTDHEDTR